LAQLAVPAAKDPIFFPPVPQCSSRQTWIPERFRNGSISVQFSG
jgi:hypothetical protein